jgi:hypothetical protein
VPAAGDACGSDAEERRQGNGRYFRHHNGRASSGRRRQNGRASGRAAAPLVRFGLLALVLSAPDPGNERTVSRAAAIRSGACSRQINRLHQTWIVVLDVADTRADRPANHPMRRVGNRQRFQLSLVCRLLTKPCRPCHAENHGHAIMKSGAQFVRQCGYALCCGGARRPARASSHTTLPVPSDCRFSARSRRAACRNEFSLRRLPLGRDQKDELHLAAVGGETSPSPDLTSIIISVP